ncbi:hypothetical protein ABK249_03720 [Neorhizobium sp. Rsf11]|uniref:Uncharacterized protein n=3 Tax=Rhizobium/Agrobacterium group TaxID=227290 RepID=A0ABV0LWP9_9HYPH|nr:hypothetical protein [Neorhizobium petrolearium]WGI71385.1 hypothetical protein QEO92_26640 [Neorhizobium petrolearium]
MISAAHAKKSAMGLPMEKRLSEEDLIVTVEYLSRQELYCSHSINSIKDFAEPAVNATASVTAAFVPQIMPER